MATFVERRTMTRPTPRSVHPGALFLALAVVFLVKVLIVWQLAPHPLLQPDAGLDTTAYVDLARRVLGGDPGLGPGLYYVSPLYIYFLALAYGVTGTFLGVRIVQAALGTLTVGLVFFMAERWGGRRAGWIALVIAAACGVLTFHEALLMQSAIDGVLTAAALAALTLALDGRAPRASRWFIAAGLMFGLQTLNRPNILAAALAVVAALALLRGRRPALLVAGGLVLGLLPVAARNIAVAGQWTLVSSHGGLNFYIGNSATATGLYQVVPGIRPDIVGQEEDTRRVAERAEGRPLSDAEVSDYFFGLGVTWIRTHPGAASALFLRKLVLAVHGDHAALPQSYEFYAGDAHTGLRWLALNPWLFMPFGLAGLLVAWPPGRGRAFFAWAAFVPGYALALAVFFVSERYRIPLFVALAVTAGLFVERVLSVLAGSTGHRGTRRWIAGAGVAVVASAAVVNWPLKLADSREGDRLRMAQHAAASGQLDEADRWVTLAVDASTDQAGAAEVAGRVLLHAGQPARALPWLERAHAAGRSDAELAVDLAEALGARAATDSPLPLDEIDWNKVDDATLLLRAARVADKSGGKTLAGSLFERAVSVDPAQPDAWAQLGFHRLIGRQFEEAHQALQHAVDLRPSDPVALGGLAACELNLGNRDAARRYAEAALAIDPGELLSRQVLAALGRGGLSD